MSRLHPHAVSAFSIGLLLSLAVPVGAEDWPAWRGPNRDGICQEKGLLKDWPADGPKLLWKATGLGEGYSTPSVVGDLLFTMGVRDDHEFVIALDWKKDGKQAWATDIGPVKHKGSGYPGPRSTPTFDNGRVYALGISGTLVCLEARSGRAVWQRDLVNDFGGKVPNWGYSESVLVDGLSVLCTPGGKSTIVALQKSSGRPVWSSPIGDPASYSSIIKFTTGKKQTQYVQFTARAVVGVNAKDGKPQWRYDHPANGTAVISTPVTMGQTVFAASGYNTGGGLVWIKSQGTGYTAQELYFTKEMKNHHGGLIVLDGYLYGADESALTCLDYKTGKTQWADRGPGKCSLLYADGMLYSRSERGPVSLVEATPQGFRPHGRFDQPDRSSRNAWPHPVIANGRLFLRDQDILLCYDVRGN